MNPVQQSEIYRLDHQERLREAHNSRLARQLPRRPSRLAQLSHSVGRHLANLFHGGRRLELAQPK